MGKAQDAVQTPAFGYDKGKSPATGKQSAKF